MEALLLLVWGICTIARGISHNLESVLSPQDKVDSLGPSKDPLYTISSYPALLEYETKRYLERMKPPDSAELMLDAQKVSPESSDKIPEVLADLRIGPEEYLDKADSHQKVSPESSDKIPEVLADLRIGPEENLDKADSHQTDLVEIQSKTDSEQLENSRQTIPDTQQSADQAFPAKEVNLLESNEDDEGEELSYPEQIYAKLKSLFGTKDQLLTMEWPGRILSEETFWFESKDQYSNYLKPQTIKDAEFRLTDDVIPMAQITGGVSNAKLSSMYKLATGYLVESTDYPPEQFLVQKKKAREFLSRRIGKESVMELHQRYLSNYNNVSNYWAQRQNQLKQNARVMSAAAEGSDAALNKDSMIDGIVMENDRSQSEQNAAWKDLVIKGLHHEVMSALSMLDTKSPGEMLQEAKDRIRTSGTTSLDGSEITYPVSFQPERWAELLSTAFTPVDLLMSSADALAHIKTLQQNRAALQDQLSVLVASNDLVALAGYQTKSDEAKLAHEGFYKKLEEKVGMNTAQMITLYCSSGACITLKDADYATADAARPWDPVDVSVTGGLAQLVQDCVKTNENWMSALRSLGSAQIGNEISAAGSMADQIADLHKRITEFTKQLEDATAAYSAVAGRKSDTVSDEDFFPSMPKAGPWSRVILKSQRSSATKKSGMSEDRGTRTTTTDVTSVGDQKLVVVGWCNPWNNEERCRWESAGRCKTVDFPGNDADKYTCPEKVNRHNWAGGDTWPDRFDITTVLEGGSWKVKACRTDSTDIWGMHLRFYCNLKVVTTDTKTTNTYNATSFVKDVIEKSEFSIGFEVAKVTIGRGWFKPEFLEHTDLYMRFGNKTISRGMPTEEDWYEYEKIQWYRDTLLPCYPIAFVLARDITIIIKSSKLTSENRASVQATAQSGNLKGFSTSGTYSGGSVVRAGSAAVGFSNDAMVIKIAGAQILMWIQNFIGKDRSVPLRNRKGSNSSGYDVLDDIPDHYDYNLAKEQQ